MAKIKILRNFECPAYSPLFMRLDEAALCTELQKRLKSELKHAKAEILKATEISAGGIFERYFDLRPPFGRAKKKHEFPDAFVLSALEAWCAKKKQKVYVLSTDPDMQSACSDRGPLLYLRSIGEFVDLVLREENDAADFLAQLFIDNPKPIIEAVIREFEDHYVNLEDEDGDGEASVSDVQVGAAAVVSLEDDEAVLELDATICFTADVSYTDRNMEWHSKRASLERSEEVPVEVTIKFDRKNHLNYEVVAAKVNNGESVTIYVDESAETHWR